MTNRQLYDRVEELKVQLAQQLASLEEISKELNQVIGYVFHSLVLVERVRLMG